MKRPNPNETQQRDHGIARLAEYWFRAKLMHDLLHQLMNVYGGDLKAAGEAGHSWELLTYLYYWLSGLFVVVEGFNKLKLKDAHVQQLFNSHVQALRELRHQTYHFVLEKPTEPPKMIDHLKLSWAEELHHAIGAHIREVVRQKLGEAQAQKFEQMRSAIDDDDK